MSSTVYLETSIIGYLASRPSRDVITGDKDLLEAASFVDTGIVTVAEFSHELQVP